LLLLLDIRDLIVDLHLLLANDSCLLRLKLGCQLRRLLQRAGTEVIACIAGMNVRFFNLIVPFFILRNSSFFTFFVIVTFCSSL
jgi:hypothetical protein